MAQRKEGRGFILKLATDLRMEEWNPSRPRTALPSSHYAVLVSGLARHPWA